MVSRTHIYFASDLHLGVDGVLPSREREILFVKWLDDIADQAKEIYLVGDVFDFWFEWKHAVPRGFSLIQGKIRELTSAGVEITMFAGNHDMWNFHYFQQELGVNWVDHQLIKEFNGRKFLIGHGDGLGPGDMRYKLMKKFFRSRLCQWLFARIHPNLAIAVGAGSSKRSRKAQGVGNEKFKGEDKEWILQYCKQKLASGADIDYFIFGHRHLPIDFKFENGSRYINLGDWLAWYTYGVWDGQQFQLKSYRPGPGPIHTNY